jgi:hypothetical protein
MLVTRHGFGLITEFIGHLLLLTTDNYSTFVIIHNFEITTALPKTFQSAVSSRTQYLVTASSN